MKYNGQCQPVYTFFTVVSCESVPIRTYEVHVPHMESYIEFTNLSDILPQTKLIEGIISLHLTPYLRSKQYMMINFFKKSSVYHGTIQ